MREESLVLGVQARVPVDLAEVEGEGAAGLVLLSAVWGEGKSSRWQTVLADAMSRVANRCGQRVSRSAS